MRTLLVFIAAIFCCSLFAQNYKFTGKVSNYNNDTMYLAYVFGNSQYILDTSVIVDNTIVFEGSDTLRSGVFYVITPPENNYFLVMVDGDQTEMNFEVDMSDAHGTLKFEDSKDNDAYYAYSRFLAKARLIQQDYNQKYQNQPSILQDSLEALNLKVESFRDHLLTNNSGSLTNVLIKSTMSPELSEHSGTEEEIKKKQYSEYKNKYFEFIDFQDERLLRTPFFHNKVMEYINNLTPKHPDSIAVAMDLVLSKMEGNEPVYQYFLSTFLNEYIQPKVMGMDKVYVHLVDNYYSKGKTPWVLEDQMLKIVDNANFYRGTLVGNIAPALTFKPRDQSPISLDDIQSEYKILIFWSPTCSHCKEELPTLPDVKSQLIDRDVEFVVLCTKEEEACWNFVDEKELMGDWIHAQPMTPTYYRDYDLRLTPRIYILDQKNEVLFKNISMEQITNAFDILDKEKQSN